MIRAEMRWGWPFFLAAGLLGCTNDCDPAGLQSRLDGAGAGTIVQAGACRIEVGQLTVPTGVTLRGAGVGQTVIAGSGEGAAVVLHGGARLESLDVEVDRGRAVMLSDAASGSLRHVRLIGPLDAGSAASLPPLPGPTQTATHGLVLVNAGTADAPIELEDVHASGFGRFGVLAVDSHVTWMIGSASENLGTSLMVQRGSIALANVEICSTWRGLQPFAYGAVFEGASVSSDGVVVCDNEGPGMLHESASADHRGLSATGNSDAALWVQNGVHFSVDSALIADNGLSGIVAVASSDVAVRSSQIAMSRQVVTIDPVFGEIRVGDGMQFVGDSAAGLAIENVTFDRNQRVGLLLQVRDGIVPSGTVSGVTVVSEGTAFGAVAQTETTIIAPDTWSSGITREGTAITNDATFTDRVSVLGAVAPMFFPPPEI